MADVQSHCVPVLIQITYLTIQTDDRQEFYVSEFILGKRILNNILQEDGRI